MEWAAQQRERLANTLRSAGPDAPTLCEGWTTGDLAAHLVVRETSTAALGIVVPAFAAKTEQAMTALRDSEPYGEIVDTFAAGPTSWVRQRLDEAMNLAEFFVHCEDVLRAGDWDGHRRTLDPRLEDALWDRLKPMARLMYRRSPVPVALYRDSGDTLVAKRGTGGVRITGRPGELVLHAFGRPAVADVEVAGPPDALAAFAGAGFGV